MPALVGGFGLVAMFPFSRDQMVESPTMEFGRVLRRVGIAVGIAVAAVTALTLARARGRRPPPPDGSGWHQVS